MKTFFRIVGILLLLLVVTAGLLIAFAPTENTIQRSVTINASQPAVFDAMSHFRQWPSWTTWARKDPAQQTVFGGTDGQPGSTYAWVSKEVGEGRMTATAVTGTRMAYTLNFIQPFEAHNQGWVEAVPAGNGTTATMGMTARSPRPWNAMGWLFKGAIAADFEEGLQTLKANLESGRAAGAAR